MVEQKESEVIKAEIERKKKEIEELNLNLLNQEALIKEGKAYRCGECGFNANYDQDKDWTREKLCYSCYRKKKRETLKKDLEEKLIGARITDVDVKGNQIYGITLYNKGMTHELKAQDSGDEYGNGYMEMDDSYRQKDSPVFDDEVKPSQKQRKEKRLPEEILKCPRDFTPLDENGGCPTCGYAGFTR